MKTLFAILVLGGLGAWIRFGIGHALPGGNEVAPHWGTLAANLLGCLAFGVVVSLEEQGQVSAWAKLVLLTGLMGAWTTFSSYLFDLVRLARAGAWGIAGMTFLAHNCLGILALLAGMRLGAELFQPPLTSPPKPIRVLEK